MSTATLRVFLLAAAGCAATSCTLENPTPDLPLAVAPGFEVVEIPKEPRPPSIWDRPASKWYDEAGYVPPAEGTFEEGQSRDPLFGDPLGGEGGDAGKSGGDGDN